MSKSSIYETKWTDLVFENRNKEYGAYQLRQENAKTTITALFAALLFIAALGSASMLISKLGNHEPVTEPTVYTDPITPVDMQPIPVQPQEPPAAVQPPQASAPATDLQQLVNPVVVTTEQATPVDIAHNTDNAPVSDNTNSGVGTTVNTMPTSGGGGNGEVAAPPVVDNSPVNVAILDKLPEFPGGIAKFYTYVSRNFVTPEMDTERVFKVYVSFVVEKDGSITDIVARNDPGYGIGKEAVRVLKSLKTKWAPGMIDGKAVRTAYNLPITIKTQPE